MKVSQVNKEGLEDLEQLMQTSLPSVNPRPEFVHQLRQRLTDPLLPTVRFPRKVTSQFLLLIAVGVISGVIFILTASRLVKGLIDMMRGIR